MSCRWILAILGVVVLVCGGCGKPPPGPSTPPVGVPPTPFIASPVRQPPVKQASEANLPDETPIVGVVVGGKARAYSLAALSPMTRHVVNDLISDVPVTVTYCNHFDCLRVYSSPDRGKVLEVSQMGRGADGLLLSYQGQIFCQSNGKPFGREGPDMALDNLPATRTTWKAWREKHPETEIYTGLDSDPEPTTSHQK